MRLSHVMFFGMFLLCCCGFGERAAGALCLRKGRAAGALLLAGLLAGLSLPLGEHISLSPAFLLLLCAGLCQGNFRGEAALALLTAFTSGILAWLVHAALPGFQESGLLIGAAAALIGLMLPERRLGLTSVLLAPLFYGFLLMLEDWYIFDVILFSFGSPIQLDGQACGLFFYGCGVSLLPEIPYAKILLKIKA